MKPLPPQPFKGVQFKVEAQERLGHVDFVEKNLIYYQREDHYLSEKFIVDTFGPQTILAWADFDPKVISVCSGTENLHLKGPHAILIPPWSLVYWKIGGGSFRWQAVVSFAKDALPFQDPVIYQGAISSIPKKAEEILPLIQKFKPIHHLKSYRIFSSPAFKLKKFIDENFQENISIIEMAEIFKSSRVVMSRNFSRSYGLSPLQYRQRVRMFNAMVLINTGTSITDSIYQSGFSSMSEFNRQFKNFMTVPPNAFSPRHQRQ